MIVNACCVLISMVTMLVVFGIRPSIFYASVILYCCI